MVHKPQEVVLWLRLGDVELPCNTLKFHHQNNVSNKVFILYFLRIK
jgi:hypothetical protein